MSGSFGETPTGFRLPAATRPGPVRLAVADLERSLAFYRDLLGLHLLDRVRGRAHLGIAAGRELVEVVEQPGIRRRPSRGRTGLFHFAILLPGRAALGRFLRHLAGHDITPAAADHLVSEALYLQDPDNLGVEIYADRPRSEWQVEGRQLRMATEPLDRSGLLAAAGERTWAGMPDETVIGHVHLQVGSLAQAAVFYSEALGFDRTVWGYPGALFMSAGGYHHHLAVNVWAGHDAAAPGEKEARLLEWTLELPTRESLVEATESVRGAGAEPVRAPDGGRAHAEGVLVRDPWGTRLRLAVPAAGGGATAR